MLLIFDINFNSLMDMMIIIRTCMYVVNALLFYMYMLTVGYSAPDNFSSPTLPNGMTCACPGNSLTYTCTVVGGFATRWIRICSGNEDITLFHSLFGGGTAVGECNSGSIVGRGVSVVNGNGEPCYVSELSFNASSDLNGRIVDCNRDAADIIGNDTVRIAGKKMFWVSSYSQV